MYVLYPYIYVHLYVNGYYDGYLSPIRTWSPNYIVLVCLVFSSVLHKCRTVAAVGGQILFVLAFYRIQQSDKVNLPFPDGITTAIVYFFANYTHQVFAMHLLCKLA
jgi:hypothetical protein